MARIEAKTPRGLERLDEVIVRVTNWVSLAFFVVLIALGLVSGDGNYLWQSINPAAPALVGFVMIRRGTPRALTQLAAGGIAIAITIGLLDVGLRSGALLGLVSMGIVGTLLVRSRVVVYLTIAGLAISAIAYWWNVEDVAGQERLATALSPALAFLLAAGLIAWLRSELLIEGQRGRAATAALAASEEQFRTAFETSSAMMVLLGLEDGRFLKVNPAGCEMLGYSEEELLAMTTSDVTHPDDRAASRDRQLAVRSGEVEHTQATLRLVRKDGSIAHGLVSAAMVTDAEGAPLHFVANIVDTTEQRVAEQQLIDLLASRDELIASVSHELRTPLTAVLGYAGILQEAAPGVPPADYELMLREIVTQGADLVAIIEDLLVFAQSDSNSLTVNHVDLDLREQATLVLESLRPELAVEHVVVSNSRVRAMADPIRTRQVLRNLLSNASRYGGDTIVVDFAQVESQASIVVSDNGKGVPEEDRERIFEPYQRSRPEDGLTAAIGVGLTVARRLARLMDGELTYEYQDGTSRFEVTLPASRVAAEV